MVDGGRYRSYGIFRTSDVELDREQVIVAADGSDDLLRVATGCDHCVSCSQRGFGQMNAQATAGSGDKPNLFVCHEMFLEGLVIVLLKGVCHSHLAALAHCLGSALDRFAGIGVMIA
ncbi:hypothetical protein D3C85_1454590 [compost metagenome]